MTQGPKGEEPRARFHAYVPCRPLPSALPQHGGNTPATLSRTERTKCVPDSPTP